MPIRRIQFLLLAVLLNSVSCFIDSTKNEQFTWKNQSFRAFRGIKYAESPTGALRFQNPVRAWTWNNITAILEQHLNTDGSDCPSPNKSNGPYNEDCLYLNVYTKHFNSTDLLPVIVFIHPGGLYVGSGSSQNFGAHYLLEEDIVLVTFNYRLAFFGFTSVSPDVPIANAGFKDQSLVLAWIQDHIHHFGGDKNCVTLMGDSAGAMSVALHLVSPMSRNYFHRAFLLSGGLLPQKIFPKEQKNLISKLAQLIDCDDNENDFDCVNRTDTTSITTKLRKIFEFGHDNPVYPWLPILETENIPAEQRFLDLNPFESLRIGDFARIPIMVSVVKNELGASGMQLLEKDEEFAAFLEDFKRLGPICFLYEPNDTVSKELYRKYVKYNSIDTRKSFGSFQNLVQGFSDALINFPQYRFSQMIKNYTDVFFLKFEYRGSFSNLACDTKLVGDICDKIAAEKMVEHTDDLQYIFTSVHRPTFTVSSDEARIVDKYTKMLAQFARTGVPLISTECDTSSNHLTYNSNHLKFTGGAYNETYIKFDGDYSLARGPFENAAFWDYLFPIQAP